MSDRYHNARQRHIGNMLDKLQTFGLLSWEWRYDSENHRAVYLIALTDEPTCTCDTKHAEQIVQRTCNAHKLVWLPVPHPGGESQLRETQRKIAEIERQRRKGGGPA